MSQNDEQRKTEVERLETLEQLVDRYAQSRALPLLIPLAIMVLNAVLLLSAGKLAELLVFRLELDASWLTVFVIAIILWVFLSSIWLAGRLINKYGACFYKREGTIELQRDRVPVWASTAYLITLLGATFLSAFGIMSVRCALTFALTSFGTFMLYVGKKHREKALGVVLGGLCLAQAGLTAAGVRIPFLGQEWPYSYFAALMIYIVGDGLITALVVHIYNRKMLRKIKELRLFGEDYCNTSDTQQY
ncbi:MAG: hypothetical protein ACYTEQ_07225 [Planctomycetota bacterium]|jgi:hypothetical protein